MSTTFNKETWPATRVRQTFIDYFTATHDHKFVPSSPILPHDDPTLMFANSGMNQFKPIFLNQLPDGHPFTGMTRAANSQKCLRAGGKHNDLEEVGFDVYHHTFFEMLGNWSFGCYFKEEAITWSWTLLTEVYGIPGDRLYATYFGGDPKKPGVPPDTEARDIWRRFLPDNRILPFNAKDNFWEMGETGPCGPCTEIHYDRIGNREVPELVNMDDPNVLEIWNNVFMQFNCDVNGQLAELPAQHVDTGMGFERLTSVMQGVMSNYDTDIFDGIFAAIQADTGCRAYTGKVGEEDTDGVDMAYRVVADHIRALTFAITDYIDPDASGRGYVLTRILRRGVRYANQFLGARPGFFSRLCSVVVNEMSDFFPELTSRAEHVKQTILSEEMAFQATLTRGLKRFGESISGLQRGDELDGAIACDLYSTYGFPLDLTRLMCDEKGIIVDEKACEEALEKLRMISRAGEKEADLVLSLNALQADYLGRSQVEGTDDTPKFEWKSIGEGSPLTGCTVKALCVGLRSDLEHEMGFVQEVNGDCPLVGIVLDKTSYYAESGGQIFDTGVLRTADGVTVNVTDCQKFGSYVLHIGTLENKNSTLSVGTTVDASVDYARRALIAKNHTSTHVLNYALRQVLGDADQRGSLCDTDKLRFDFSFNKQVKVAEIKQIEEIVQRVVDEKQSVDKLSVPYTEAKEINALRAVFGERYPTTVRVVAVAPAGTISQMLQNPEDQKWFDYSVEFCGGTHLDNFSEAEKFVIISEEGTSRGVRRLVALTADKAREAIAEGEALSQRFDDAAAMDGLFLQSEIKLLTVALENVVCPIVAKDAMAKQLKSLNKKYIEFKKTRSQLLQQKAMDFVNYLADEHKGAAFVLVAVDADGSGKILKKAGAALQKKLADTAILFYSVDSDNNSLSVFSSVPASKQGALTAPDWAMALVGPCNGKAGGKAGSSSGASRDATHLTEGVEAATKMAQAFN